MFWTHDAGSHECGSIECSWRRIVLWRGRKWFFHCGDVETGIAVQGLHNDSNEWSNILWNLAGTGQIKFGKDALRPCRKDQLRFTFKPNTDGVLRVPFTGFDGQKFEASDIRQGDLFIVNFLFQVYNMTFDPRMLTEKPVTGTRHVLWSLQVLDPAFDVPTTKRYPVVLTPKKLRTHL